MGTPKDESPKDENPKDETPKDETPKDETPKDENPKDESPKDETPKDGTESMVSVIDDAQEQDVPHGPNVMKMVMCIAAGGFVIGLGLLGYLLVVKRYSAREIAEPTVEMASTSSEIA